MGLPFTFSRVIENDTGSAKVPENLFALCPRFLDPPFQSRQIELTSIIFMAQSSTNEHLSFADSAADLDIRDKLSGSAGEMSEVLAYDEPITVILFAVPL